jgi:DNA-directed RNA polymerase specialized sigma24 family protein
MKLQVGTLREVFRHLEAFRSLHESEGLEVIPGPDGTEWSLWDLEYLLEEAESLLPPRQYEAIQLCLVQNLKEKDAAIRMGVSDTNPVAKYATFGLEKLIAAIEDGRLPRFRWQPEREAG